MRPDLAKSPLLRRLMAFRWTLFDAALAIGLIIFTVQDMSGRNDDRWVFTVPPMVVALLIRRRFPMLAVVLAVVVSVIYHLDPKAAIAAMEFAVPLTVYTLASKVGQSRRRAVTGLAIVLVCVSLLSVGQIALVSSQGAEPEAGSGQPLTPEQQERLARKQAVTDTYNTTGKQPMILDNLPVKAPDYKPPTLSELILAAVTQALSILLVIALAFAIGDGVRSRRAHLMTLEKRADDLEREQRQRVALSLAGERARITRELHDVVAHALSVMVVQAQGGAAALRRHPDRTEVALQNVITTGRTSLAEMRRLLGLVRQDPAGDPQRTPQPGVDALPELIDGVRAAGTPVTFVVEGDPVPLPLTVDLSAYRIVQEALTNTIKHAGGTGVSAQVRIAYRPDEIELEVMDDGRGPATQAMEGNGLRGIAERVAVLGGELEVGGHSGGGDRPGWRVHATLPLRPKGIPA